MFPTQMFLVLALGAFCRSSIIGLRCLPGFCIGSMIHGCLPDWPAGACGLAVCAIGAPRSRPGGPGTSTPVGATQRTQRQAPRCVVSIHGCAALSRCPSSMLPLLPCVSPPQPSPQSPPLPTSPCQPHSQPERACVSPPHPASLVLGLQAPDPLAWKQTCARLPQSVLIASPL